MAQVWRVTVDWSGGKIGTGFSNMFFNTGVSTAQVAADAVRKFFSDSYSIGAGLPTGVTLNFRPIVDTVEATNGEQTSTTAVVAPAPVVGSDSTRYAAVAGACVTWRTGEFINGHRITGRTFLVPVGGGVLGTDGTLDTTFLGFINTAAAALVASPTEFVVWRRPTAPAATDGTTHLIAAGTCRDKTAYLTSRRD